MCLKLQVGKVQRPLFQDTHIRSRVSGLMGLRTGPPGGPGRVMACGHGGASCWFNVGWVNAVAAKLA